MFRKRTNIMKTTAGVLVGAMLAVNAAPINVLNTVYASQIVDLQTDNLAPGSITGNITDLDFSNYEFLTDTDEKKEVDRTFVGRIDVNKNAGKEATLIQYENERVLQLKTVKDSINAYCGTPKGADLLEIEFKVRFSDTNSKRQFLQMRGKTVDGNYAWPTLLTFQNDGAVYNAQNEKIGEYEADTWYTIQAEVDSVGQTYRIWMESEKGGNSVSSEGTLNVGGSGDHTWNGLLQNKFVIQAGDAQGDTPHFTELAYVKAGDLQTHDEKPGIITGSVTKLDFSNYDFLTDTDVRNEVDRTFVGRVDLDKNGGNAAELVPYEQETVLQLKAMGAAVNTYCGTPGNTDPLGVEFKVRFSDTTSQRSFLQMKGKASGGNYAWPTLLTFKNDGTIRS